MRSFLLPVGCLVAAIHCTSALVAPSSRALNGRWARSHRRTRVEDTRLRALSLAESLSVTMFDFETTIQGLVRANMGTVTPLSVGVTWTAGVLTSLSPCCLSLLPVTVALLSESALGESDNKALRTNTLLYALGLAVTLSAAGFAVSFLGAQIGSGVQGVAGGVDLEAGAGFLLALVTLTMGLSLLNVVRIDFPSIGDALPVEGSAQLRSLLLGATSALISSPCGSPVLTAILGFAAASGNAWVGLALLLSYSVGYCSPLALIGLASGTALQQLSNPEGGLGVEWTTPLLGSVLVAFGTYNALGSIF